MVMVYWDMIKSWARGYWGFMGDQVVLGILTSFITVVMIVGIAKASDKSTQRRRNR